MHRLIDMDVTVANFEVMRAIDEKSADRRQCLDCFLVKGDSFFSSNTNTTHVVVVFMSMITQ